MALLVLGVGFWKTRKYVPFEKYKNKASGAREKVFLSPAPAKPLFLTHWVHGFPEISRFPLGYSIEPLTHWVHGFHAPAKPKRPREP